MNHQENTNWHTLVDRFIWYEDIRALSLIPEIITDEEIKKYLFTIHGDNMSLEEIRKWRLGEMQA
jgi:hypothetical protein